MVIIDYNYFHSNTSPTTYLFWHVDSSLCVFIILVVRYFWEAHTFILLITVSCIDLDRRKHDTDGIMCSINDNKAAEGDFYTGDII